MEAPKPPLQRLVATFYKVFRTTAKNRLPRTESLNRLVDTQAGPVGAGMDSNHELDRSLKSHNLLILKSR
jgi:hypothetical protein